MVRTYSCMLDIKCLKGLTWVQPELPLLHCTAFNHYPGSCCNRTTEVSEVLNPRDALMSRVSSENLSCFLALQTILCGFCHPLSGHVFGTEQQTPRSFPSLCTAFCLRFYDACANVSLHGRSTSALSRIPGVPQISTDWRMSNLYPQRDGYCAQYGAMTVGHCVTGSWPLFCFASSTHLVFADLSSEEIGPQIVYSPPDKEKVTLRRVLAAVDFPTLLAPENHLHIIDVRFSRFGSSNLTCVAFQSGQIVAVDSRDQAGRTFLDLSRRVFFQDLGESGLLGFAFDPDFNRNGFVYVKYTPIEAPVVRLSRFRIRDDRLILNADSELELINSDREAVIHHGGAPVFGADGLLYLPVGDSMAWGATRHTVHPALDMSSWRGKILRINVSEGTEISSALYGIPRDNPFIGVAGARPEVRPQRIQVSP